MANTNKIVPELRFPEFVDDGEWEEIQLDDCLDYLQPTKYLVKSTNYNKTYSTPVLTAGKTFVLGYTKEKNGIFNKKLPVIIFDDFTTASKFVNFPFKAKSSAMKILLAKNDANIKFIYESMQIIKYEVGVHKRHWISIFSKLKIVVPNPKEQQKIANCLSSLDNLIGAETEKLNTLKDHKKGLLQQLFPADGETVPQLRFPEFVDDGEWEEKELKNVAEIKGRIGYRGYTVKDLVEKGKGAISLSPSNINNDGILTFEKATYISWDKYDESPEIILKEGYTVLVKTASVGKTAFIKDLPEKATINPQFVVLKPIQITPEFMPYIVAHYNFQKQVRDNVGAGAVPNISQEVISKLKIVVPNPKEQQKIANCLTSLDELITAETEKIEYLKEHKKGLMQQLFPMSEP